MGLSFHCPQCSQTVPALPTQMGQQVSCPTCKTQFRLSPALLGGNGHSTIGVKGTPVAAVAAPAPAPPPVAASPPLAPPVATSSPPVATVVRQPPPVRAAVATSPPRAAAPAAVATPAPVPPAQQPPKPNVARFIAAASQDSSVQLTADGKLPELSLAEATAKKAKTSESPTSPLVLGLVLSASTLFSILLLAVDFSGGQASDQELEEARQKIQRYCASETGPLKPYQELLRQSQRAHSRRDYQDERKYYRRVLELLRSESKDRYAGVTGTQSDDEELKRLLAVLLSTEGR